MGADVAHASGGPRTRGIGAPLGLLVAARFLRLRKPTLDVLRDHPAHVAQRAGTHQMARLLHHRIAGVVVRQAEDQFLLGDEGGEFLRLREVERDGFVRHDVEAGFERRFGDGEVGVVGRGDDDEIHALVRRSRRFAGEQFLVAAVASRRVDAVEFHASAATFRRVAGERAAGERDTPVEFRRHAVNRADERALPTADQAHPQFRHAVVLLLPCAVSRPAPSTCA